MDTQIVDFFCDAQRQTLEFRDKYLNEEYKVKTVLGEAALAQYHPKLQKLVLVNCGLSDDSIETIIKGLINAN